VAPFERYLSLIRVSFVQEPQSKRQLPNSARAGVGNGYQLYLPIFGWYSPSGTYTEGAGVRPDVPIDIYPDRLACGEDAQVNKALELLE
jgi:C-terminal processing protease CtpA/Prc